MLRVAGLLLLLGSVASGSRLICTSDTEAASDEIDCTHTIGDILHRGVPECDINLPFAQGAPDIAPRIWKPDPDDPGPRYWDGGTPGLVLAFPEDTATHTCCYALPRVDEDGLVSIKECCSHDVEEEAMAEKCISAGDGVWLHPVATYHI